MVRIIFSNLILLLILLAVSSSSYSHRVRAYESVVDNFNKEIEAESIWDFLRIDGISFQTLDLMEFATFKGSDIYTFPFLRTIDLSTIDPTLIEVHGRFNSNPINQGAGIIFSDTKINELQQANFNSYLFYIWPKPNGSFHLFTPVCPSSNQECNSNQQLVNGVLELPSFEWHYYALTYNDSKYKFFIDGMQYFESVLTDRPIKYFAIGQPEIVSTNSVWPIFDIDSVSINTSLTVPTPSTLPSYSPYPYYSQKDPSWGEKIYDHAVRWAKSGKRGIDRWGCALTSAAMVLKNHNIKSPAGVESTPEVLNRWLKEEKDGYIRNGLLNWIAVTRYAKESRANGNAPTSLEFKKELYDESTVEKTLSDGIDPILGIPGHFVLAYHDSGDSFAINDPYDSDKKQLPKASSILTSNTFYPSNTDLSYFMVASNTTTSIEIRDQNGQLLPAVQTDERIADDVDGTDLEIVRTTYIAKPVSGKYTLTLTNAGSRLDTVEVYLYDKNGGFSKNTLRIAAESKTMHLLSYDSSSANKSWVDHKWKKMWKYWWFWHVWREMK